MDSLGIVAGSQKGDYAEQQLDSDEDLPLSKFKQRKVSAHIQSKF